MFGLIRAALLSVTDKSNIIPVAEQLVKIGLVILSTGGTAKKLRDAGIPVIEVSAYTGFPEMMDGRLKTLHPWIYGGILRRPGIDEKVMVDNGMKYIIDVVICNLYKFEEKIAEENCTYADATESIDIGGPAMIRAAAKNENIVYVVTNPNQYTELIEALYDRLDAERVRRVFAAAAYRHTANYDIAIADYKEEQLAA